MGDQPLEWFENRGQEKAGEDRSRGQGPSESIQNGFWFSSGPWGCRSASQTQFSVGTGDSFVVSFPVSHHLVDVPARSDKHCGRYPLKLPCAGVGKPCCRVLKQDPPRKWLSSYHPASQTAIPHEASGNSWNSPQSSRAPEKIHFAHLKHGFCPPRQRETTIYKAMFRCIM